MEIDPELFQAMFDVASQARTHAYAPYSGFSVGAAILTTDGHITGGCNVEEATFQSSCAERTAITRHIATHGRSRIVAVLVVSGSEHDGRMGSPCGHCRQWLNEFGGHDTAVIICGPEGERLRTDIASLLPHAFGPENL